MRRSSNPPVSNAIYNIDELVQIFKKRINMSSRLDQGQRLALRLGAVPADMTPVSRPSSRIDWLCKRSPAAVEP